MTYDPVLIIGACLIVSYLVFEFWQVSRPVRYLPCSNEKLPAELSEALRAQSAERKKLGFDEMFTFRRVGRGGPFWGVIVFHREVSAVLVYTFHRLSWDAWRIGQPKGVIHVHCPPPVYHRLRIGFESLTASKRLVTVNKLVPLLENIWDCAPDSITQKFDTISSLTAAWEHHREELRKLGQEPSDIKFISRTEGLNMLGRKLVPLT